MFWVEDLNGERAGTRLSMSRHCVWIMVVGLMAWHGWGAGGLLFFTSGRFVDTPWAATLCLSTSLFWALNGWLDLNGRKARVIGIMG
jgi:hypothetical protein